MKVIEYATVEQWDGGERYNPLVNFSSVELAKKFIETTGTFQYAYKCYGLKTLLIYESLEDYDSNDLKAIKGRALAKLTPIEKKALGLS